VSSGDYGECSFPDSLQAAAFALTAGGYVRHMGRRASRFLVFLAAGALPAAGAANPPQVAFKQFPGERQAIVVLDEAGRDAVELTRGKPTPSEFGSFSWSPDGSRLVYASQGLVGGDLYSLGADGSGLARLTADGGNDDPAWSPDGARIAYVHTERVRQSSGVFRLDAEVWLVNVGGGGLRRLTTDAGQKYGPQWSPEGSRILYLRLGQRPQLQTFVLDAATGRRLLVTNGAAAWSPDGARLAVQTGGGIDVLEADGTGRRTVARRGAAGPRWSPDGRRIAFVRSACVSYLKGICGTRLSSVYDVGAGGQGERRLTGSISRGAGSHVRGVPSDDSSEPVWWPGGAKLFLRRGPQAHVMNADGTCEQQFGPRTLLLGSPKWRPGSNPGVTAAPCTDLRVRAESARPFYGRRDVARVRVVVENDGNETATKVDLTLRVAHGPGRLRHPMRSCTGATIVRCDLAPLRAGASTQLLVRVSNTRPLGFELAVSAAAGELEAETTQNSTRAIVTVLACDVVGTLGADRLSGTLRRDTICGLPGADVIVARAGDDTISGGSGPDAIRPGAGRDVVSGDEGRDRIDARDGQRDAIDCGPSLDTVFADELDRLVGCERVRRR
jgi:Tol biopolymer transport system component